MTYTSFQYNEMMAKRLQPKKDDSDQGFIFAYNV